MESVGITQVRAGMPIGWGPLMGYGRRNGTNLAFEFNYLREICDSHPGQHRRLPPQVFRGDLLKGRQSSCAGDSADIGPRQRYRRLRSLRLKRTAKAAKSGRRLRPAHSSRPRR